MLESLDVPGGPTLAAITDPEGNAVTLVQQSLLDERAMALA